MHDKATYNCLLADRFRAGERPVKDGFQTAWLPKIQRRVLDRWTGYGDNGDVSTEQLSGAPIP